jgi:hypothetical protein
VKAKFIAFLASTGVLLGLAIPGAEASICEAGNKAEVFWKDRWYPAQVLRVNQDGDRCFITYDGYDNSWDEWVGSDRIRIYNRYGEGSQVSVYWKGSWYAAQVLKVRRGSYYITYDGYSSSWDEWVGLDRIRPR